MGQKPLKNFDGEDLCKRANEKIVRKPRIELERHTREGRDETNLKIDWTEKYEENVQKFMKIIQKA